MCGRLPSAHRVRPRATRGRHPAHSSQAPPAYNDCSTLLPRWADHQSYSKPSAKWMHAPACRDRRCMSADAAHQFLPTRHHRGRKDLS
jgi:hypothetical protein